MEKIFSFIVNNKSGKLLLLLGNPNDPQFKRSFWYVVTGGKENEDESLEDTVKREIKEETDLDANEILYLNWIFKYQSLGKDCTEYVYISFVEDDKITLNEEHIDYKWCDLNEFLEKIELKYNKENLRKILKKAMLKERFFLKTKIDIYHQIH